MYRVRGAHRSSILPYRIFTSDSHVGVRLLIKRATRHDATYEETHNLTIDANQTYLSTLLMSSVLVRLVDWAVDVVRRAGASLSPTPTEKSQRWK